MKLYVRTNRGLAEVQVQKDDYGPAVVEASLFLASRGLWWDSAFLGYIKGGKHDEKKKYETA